MGESIHVLRRREQRKIFKALKKSFEKGSQRLIYHAKTVTLIYWVDGWVDSDNVGSFMIYPKCEIVSVKDALFILPHATLDEINNILNTLKIEINGKEK